MLWFWPADSVLFLTDRDWKAVASGTISSGIATGVPYANMCSGSLSCLFPRPLTFFLTFVELLPYVSILHWVCTFIVMLGLTLGVTLVHTWLPCARIPVMVLGNTTGNVLRIKLGSLSWKAGRWCVSVEHQTCFSALLPSHGEPFYCSGLF